MRIAVFGTGGVEGYFGGRLAQAGHEVAFIENGGTETIRRSSSRTRGGSRASPRC